jgi:hypothetical protein
MNILPLGVLVSAYRINIVNGIDNFEPGLPHRGPNVTGGASLGHMTLP